MRSVCHCPSTLSIAHDGSSNDLYITARRLQKERDFKRVDVAGRYSEVNAGPSWVTIIDPSHGGPAAGQVPDCWPGYWPGRLLVRTDSAGHVPEFSSLHRHTVRACRFPQVTPSRWAKPT